MSDKLKPGAIFPLKGGGAVKLLTALVDKRRGQWEALKDGDWKPIIVKIVDGEAVRVE